MEKSRKAVDVPRLIRQINTQARHTITKPGKQVFPYIQTCQTKPTFPLYSRHGVRPVHDHKETYKESLFDFKPRRIVPKRKNHSSSPLDLTIDPKQPQKPSKVSQPPNTTKAVFSPRPTIKHIKKNLYQYEFYEDRFAVGEDQPVVICVTRRQKRSSFM